MGLIFTRQHRSLLPLYLPNLDATYLECQPRRDVLLSASRVVERVARVERELATDGHVALVREVIGAPEGKTVRVAVIAALILSRVVEESVVVHFLTGVVLMDISPGSFDLVRRVLN